MTDPETVSNKIGFIQGRLSPRVDGKIQAFPWGHWKNEFPDGERAGFQLIEWTLDQDRLRENPLLTVEGRDDIRSLMDRHGLGIETVTGDNFMHAPYYKVSGLARAELLDDFAAIVRAMGDLGGGILVVPLVDDGRIDTDAEEQALFEGLFEMTPILHENNVRIGFESDLSPEPLAEFIAKLPADLFGINYDIGNSAALGYDPTLEISAYGDRIINVHVKDRSFGGTTVPLGDGDADFEACFRGFRRIGYSGAYILQTARAEDKDHYGQLTKFKAMVDTWVQG